MSASYATTSSIRLAMSKSYGLGLRVDGHCLGADPDVEPEARAKPPRCLQEEGGTILDHAAHVIGQSAVGGNQT